MAVIKIPKKDTCTLVKLGPTPAGADKGPTWRISLPQLKSSADDEALFSVLNPLGNVTLGTAQRVERSVVYSLELDG